MSFIQVYVLFTSTQALLHTKAKVMWQVVKQFTFYGEKLSINELLS